MYMICNMYNTYLYFNNKYIIGSVRPVPRYFLTVMNDSHESVITKSKKRHAIFKDRF